VYIYGSYRKIKTGLSLFWTTLYASSNIVVCTKRYQQKRKLASYYRPTSMLASL